MHKTTSGMWKTGTNNTNGQKISK